MLEGLHTMRSDKLSGHRTPAPLAYRIDDNSTAREIAAAFGALWLEIVAALTPIIGPRGVAALGQRSLHLVGAATPWLVARQPGGQVSPDSLDTLDVAMLVALLAQRSSDDAAAVASAFLQTLRELLSSLIGALLTERLLRTVWGPPDIPLNSPTTQ